VHQSRLITIGFSHYCEKARWALERAGVRFVEEPHAPVLHALHARPHGQRAVPILVTPQGTLRSSSAIVRHADERLEPRARLFPDDERRAEVEALVAELDDRLGPATRLVAYFHLLDDAALISRMVKGIPWIEHCLFWLTRPAATALMRRAMRIDPMRAEQSTRRIEAIFADVEARLLDGRRYLAGDRFTAADLTFAALTAPSLLPIEYGWPMPPLESVPAAFRALVERFRDRPAGQLALRIYREERRRIAFPRRVDHAT
jgi:glutathione S-transferase